MRKRGVITLVFDDGYEVIYRNILPLLNELKIKGVFAVPLNSEVIQQTESRPTVAWPEWFKVKKDGHEIAAHGISHRSLPTLSADELTQELSLPAQQLSASTLIYPGGAFNDLVKKEASQYYSAARSTRRGIETLPPRDPMALKTYNFTRHNFNVHKVNALATWTWLRGGWLIETYHLVDNTEKECVHAVTLDAFKRHLYFIKDLPIRIGTMQEVLASL